MTISAACKARRHRGLVASTALLCASLSLLAGCGGSSSSKVQTQIGIRTPAQSNADVGNTSSEAKQASQSEPAALRSSGRARRRAVPRATETPATTSDDTRGDDQGAFNPCTLVSVAEAQAIVGGRIAGRIDAPLGPTCVYKLGGSKADITLTVEALRFSQVTRVMTKRKPVMIRHRAAYCGRLGIDVLLVPLGTSQLLNVTAPCAIAQRFAALALSRLAA
jgi:hypothetical protein